MGGENELGHLQATSVDCWRIRVHFAGAVCDSSLDAGREPSAGLAEMKCLAL